ncbi:MAG: universal stress protein [Candidatus Binatia bacterium]
MISETSRTRDHGLVGQFENAPCRRCTVIVPCRDSARHDQHTAERREAVNRYKHILVPLDGSQTAEAALPHAVHLATSEGAAVTSLLVTPPIEAVTSSCWRHSPKPRAT